MENSPVETNSDLCPAGDPTTVEEGVEHESKEDSVDWCSQPGDEKSKEGSLMDGETHATSPMYLESHWAAKEEMSNVDRVCANVEWIAGFPNSIVCIANNEGVCPILEAGNCGMMDGVKDSVDWCSQAGDGKSKEGSLMDGETHATSPMYLESH
ncbi:unnamed protein product [Ilex paraguariensis]|uniref:Uncharacterized protein n=1 Tax=Ilex paraguariensis TaxID=185542 RepID=A0ABC8RYZ7_9AQUA